MQIGKNPKNRDRESALHLPNTTRFRFPIPPDPRDNVALTRIIVVVLIVRLVLLVVPALEGGPFREAVRDYESSSETKRKE